MLLGRTAVGVKTPGLGFRWSCSNCHHVMLKYVLLNQSFKESRTITHRLYSSAKAMERQGGIGVTNAT
jgi:hypothetical protein